MVSINWQFVAASILLAGGAGGTLFFLGKWIYGFFTRTTVGVKVRGADELAPPGAVEWVEDICGAMGLAPAETMLSSLKAGQSRDQARATRIAELQKL